MRLLILVATAAFIVCNFDGIAGNVAKDDVITKAHILIKQAPNLVQPSDTADIYYDGVHGTHSKEVLLYRANSLLKRAENAIHQLNTQGKLDEIRVFEKDQKLVKEMVAKLHSAKSSADLEHVESELRAAEIRLLHELQRLGLDHFLFRRDLKQNLVTKGNDLLKQAGSALRKLNKVHNTREMSFIKREGELIKKSLKELQVATSIDKIIHHEHDLRLAELRMSYHLKQADHPRKVNLPNHQQQLKQILSQRAATLAKQASEIIKKLKLEKKENEANIVEKDEALVNQLAMELSKEIPTSLLQFEQKLTEAENRLSQEISKAFQLSHKQVKRKVKSELQAQYDELLQLAAMDKLNPEDEHELVIILEAVENFLLDIDSEVHSMHPHTRFGLEAQKILEHLLQRGEHIFKNTIKKLEH